MRNPIYTHLEGLRYTEEDIKPNVANVQLGWKNTDFRHAIIELDQNWFDEEFSDLQITLPGERIKHRKIVVTVWKGAEVTNPLPTINIIQSSPPPTLAFIATKQVTPSSGVERVTYYFRRDADSKYWVEDVPDWNGLVNVPSTFPPSAHSHPNATQSVAGFLSTEDKTKLDAIAAGAEVNVNADWDATTGDAAILNKPVLYSIGPSFTSINWQAGAHFVGTLSSNTNIVFQNVIVGKTITVSITGNLTFGVNWPSGITWLSGAAPSITDGQVTHFRILAGGNNTFIGEAFNPMTVQDKTKLNGIAAGAQVNVKPNWNAAAGAADEVLNKPTIPEAGTATPSNLASTAAVGTSTAYARQDHVHLLPTKSDIGLGNVDNTSDLNKPISTATAAAISALTLGTIAPNIQQILVSPSNLEATLNFARQQNVILRGGAQSSFILNLPTPTTSLMTGDIVDLDISGFNANATITVRGNNNSAVLVYATKSALEEERFRFMVGGDDAPLEWRLVPVQSHAGRHHTGGLDPITPANISAMPAYEFRNFNLSAGQSVSLLQGRNVVVNASMSNDGNSTLTLPRMAFASTDNAIANDEIIINATNVSSVRTITVIQFNYDGGSGYLNTTTPLTIISNNGSIRLRLSAGNGYVWEIVPVDRHTQPVNTLTQSDALQGQVVTWNGTQWAPSTVIAAVSRISFGPMQLARARNTLFADSGYNPGATNNRRNNFYRQTPRGNTALGNGDTAAFPFPFNPSVFLGPGGTYSITAYVRVTGAYNDGVHCQIRRNILGFDLNGALRECWLEDVSGSKIPVDSAGSPSGALSDFGGGTGAADRVYFATQSGLAITNEWIQFVPYFSAYTPNNGATIQDVELVIYRDL